MTIIEKIKAEIERRKSLLTQHSKLTYDLILETFIKEYDDLLSFLSTLESEKPMNPSEDLEVEIAIYLNRHFLNRIKYDETIDGFTTFDAWDMAKYFYDLGCRRTAEKYDEIEYNRQRAEEQGSEGLEAEISKKYANDTTTMRTREQYAELARHFAKWGAKHLKK